MALCTETCTGLSESFEWKVGLHQGSVLSPLLFGIVMHVVSSETTSGLPACIRVAQWRGSHTEKKLKVNAGKSKLMDGSSGRKMIVSSGKSPCVVAGKGVQANPVSAQYVKSGFTSGVRGDLLLVEMISGVSDVTIYSKKLI